MAVRNIINQGSVRQRQVQEEFENEYIIEDTSIADLKEQNRKDYIKKIEDTVDINTGDTSLTAIADQLQEQPKRATIDTPAAPAKPIVRFKDPYGIQNIGFEDGQGWNIPRSRQGSLEMKAEDLAKTFDDNIGYDYQEFKNDNPIRNKKNEFFDRKNSVKIDQTGKVEHFKNKALGGGWGSKMKKAGAIGLGAIVAGGVIANLMGNGGQQTNAQLYGQQPIY